MLFYSGAGRRGVPFRHRQLTDRQIGHPIAQLAEGDLRAVRLFDAFEKLGCGDHSRRILGKFFGQVSIRRDQDKKAGAGQQHQPGPDRQPGHHRMPGPFNDKG